MRKELEIALAAARGAGDIIRAHYRAGTAPAAAKHDGTPVTRADLEANEEICRRVGAAFPDDAILAEETPDTRARLGRGRVWIIDPLDGTRDFVGRTDEFAVHVALAVGGRPAVAVVHAPARERTWWAVAGEGARADGRTLRTSPQADLAQLRIGVSRLGVNANLRRFIEGHPLGRNTVAVGASLKLMALAAGELEVSLCLTDYENEWDTCAPELIVREAGGRMTDLDGMPLVYNRPDPRHRRGLLASNGTRHEELLEIVRPFFVAGVPL